MHDTDETYALRVCTDCAGMIANGEVSPRCDIGQVPAHILDEDDAHLYDMPGDDQSNNAGTRHATRMNAHWPAADGWVLALGDYGDDVEFSWTSCDGCGSTLGGYRASATAFMMVGR